jgi:serine/threonine-protein kinase
MLGLPTGEYADLEIERRLNVDTARDFIKDREIRAGFVKSGVSEHNRLVARHPAAFGSYWKSYDFKTTNGDQNILQFPLGPKYPGAEQYHRYAFRQDGGELIFNLPNGYQAYMLIDAKGKYIPRGPIEVVFDAKQPLHNKEVINGISCMVCHNLGMQEFNDDILAANAIPMNSPGSVKVQRLFPEQKELTRIVREDRSRFLRAFELSCGDYLRVDEDKDKPIEKFPEPVGSIATQYVQDMTFTDVCAELGYSNVEQLRGLFESPLFRVYGLAVLPQGKVIKRETWDGFQKGYSVFQRVSAALQLGAMERVFPGN